MNKRKVSTERNTAAKDSTRRPSISSIQTRVTNIPQRRRSRSGKSPLPEANLIQATMTKLSKTMLATGDNKVAPPKTIFNSQDKSKELQSSSSPRLKSFPAEKIRKYDNSALFNNKLIRGMVNQQNSERSATLYMPDSTGHNYEYGDQINGIHNGHQNQSQTSENMCQQQISMNYSMHQPIPQSNGALTYRVHGPDKHRPNVPHGHQSHVTTVGTPNSLAYVHNGQTPVARSSTPATQLHPQQSQRISNEITNIQKENNWVNDELPQIVDLEKQPVGGRNLMLHRQAVMQERQQQQQQQQQHQQQQQQHQQQQHQQQQHQQQQHQQQQQQQQQQHQQQQHQQQQHQQQHMQTRSHPTMFPNMTNQQIDRPMSVPPFYNIQSSQANSSPVLTHEHPQQLYQQLQNNIAHQQQMQQRAFNQQFQMMSGHQTQHSAHANQDYYNYFPQQLSERTSFSYGMTSPQDANVNQTKSALNPMVSMQQRQQLSSQHNEAVPNSKMLIDNPNIKSQIKPYTINLVDNTKSQNVTYGHHYGQNHGQVSQMYRPTIQGQQFLNHFQQNMMPPNHVPQQVITTEMPTNLERNSLKFTPKMIRDQELLITTMKQQGISEELMRRQFDNLLKEQRRQLEYLQQFNQEDDYPDKKKQEIRKKIQIDEKPEWMAHITPPHIPYSDLEKLNAKIREQNLISSQQQFNENQPVDFNKLQQNGNNPSKMVPSLSQIYDQSQQNAYQLWQQQTGVPTGTVIPQYTYGSSEPYRHVKPMSASSQYQQNQQYQQHQQHQQQQHHQQHQQYQQYQQHFNNNPMRSQYPIYWQQSQQIQQPYQQPYQQQYHQVPEQVSWQPDQPRNEEDSRLFKKAFSLNDLNMRNVEPSSLLKLRLYKDVIRPQKRNNGLQNPDTIQKALEILNNPESQKGLEYLANLNRKNLQTKLNGMQDPNETTPNLISKPSFNNSNSMSQRAISANGLENKRNPNNPLPQPLTYLKRSEIGTTGNEYPKQKQYNPRNRYSLMAEREDGTVAPTVQCQLPYSDQQLNHQQQQNYQKLIPYNEKNPLSVLNKQMSYKFDGSGNPDYFQQLQQFYQNKQNVISNNGQGDVLNLHKSNTANIAYFDCPGGDTADLSYSRENGQIQNKMAPFGPSQRLNGTYNSPDIREAKTIGGVTYLARKPNYIPNQPMIPENTLTANKYIQPAMMYH